MSEVQSRQSAPRGRESTRGGRASYGSRGSRGGRRTANGDRKPAGPPASLEDEGEIGELKTKYWNQLKVIKEMFPDWTQEDLVFALQETNGDLEGTIERITEGTVSQWGEVKKKDRSRSKVKESISVPESAQQTHSRDSRGRGRGGAEGGRGGRGRGSDRGRGHRGARGGSAAPTNGARHSETRASAEKENVPTEATVPKDAAPPAWGESWANSGPTESWATSTSNETISDGWVKAEAPPTTSTATPPESGKSSSVIPKDTKKSWASMFAKPKPAPAPKKAPAPVPAPEPAVAPIESLVNTPPADIDQRLPAEVEALDPSLIATPRTSDVEPAINLTPSKDELTETNVEQLPDSSHPAPTVTAASTVATSQDPRATPSSNLSGQTARPALLSGYAATAQKATSGAGRSSSFQRRVLDQQEAVVMPGNIDADRAAVQFGSLGLNGTGDDLDVDEEREQAETRAQPPQHSPVAPRASLPPISQATTTTTSQPTLDEVSKPVPAPGLQATTRQQQSVSPSQAPVGSQAMATQTSQSNQYNQFGRYGQQNSSQGHENANQKPYDAFGQAPNQSSSQFDSYNSHQHPGNLSGLSSASHDYSSYYTADNSQRGFGSYYPSSYGHQLSQDVGNNQQRSGSGFGHTSTDISSQYSSAQGHQTRYGHGIDTQGSGNNTPSTNAPGGPQGNQSQASHMHQPQGQANNVPYGHPYYASPYYAAYMNQYGFGQGGYGGHFGGGGGGKGGAMYSQHGYGLSPQTSYDHSSSPAGFGSHTQGGQQPRNDGSISDYTRSGSVPQTSYQDPFNRGLGYQGPPQHQHGHTPNTQLNDGSSSQSQDNLKSQSSGPQGQSQAQQSAQQPTGAGANSSVNPNPKGPSPRPGSAAHGPASNSAPPQHGHQANPHQQPISNYGGGASGASNTYPGHLSNTLHSGAGGYGGFGGLGSGAGSNAGQNAGGYGSSGSAGGAAAGTGMGQGGFGQFGSGAGGYYGGGTAGGAGSNNSGAGARGGWGGGAGYGGH